jgi:integrase
MAVIEKRTLQDGTVSYRVKIRIKGCKPHTATFDNRADAKKWATITESDLERGLKFDDHNARTHTLKDAIAKYLEYSSLDNAPRFTQQRKKQLAWWEAKMGHLFLANIKAAEINKFKRELMTTMGGRGGASPTVLKPATVNSYIAALSVVLSHATKELHWLPFNPAQAVKKLELNNARDRHLSKSERKKLLTACQKGHPLLYPLVLLAISTGLRKGELLALTWKDIDLDREALRVMKSKNGDKRSVPLVGKALELVKEIFVKRPQNSEFVFARTDGQAAMELKKHWDKAVKEAKIDNFRFHDLRHTSATYLLESGATQLEVSAILGHRDIQMVKRYAHLADNHATKVVERMNEKVFGDE